MVDVDKLNKQIDAFEDAVKSVVKLDEINKELLEFKQGVEDKLQGMDKTSAALITSVEKADSQIEGMRAELNATTEALKKDFDEYFETFKKNAEAYIKENLEKISEDFDGKVSGKLQEMNDTGDALSSSAQKAGNEIEEMKNKLHETIESVRKEFDAYFAEIEKNEKAYIKETLDTIYRNVDNRIEELKKSVCKEIELAQFKEKEFQHKIESNMQMQGADISSAKRFSILAAFFSAAVAVLLVVKMMTM